MPERTSRSGEDDPRVVKIKLLNHHRETTPDENTTNNTTNTMEPETFRSAPITVIHNKERPYHEVYDILKQPGLEFTPRNTARATTHTFTTIQYYHKALKIIKYGHYEHLLTRHRTERPLKLIIKDIPAGTDFRRISDSLQLQNISVIVVHQMYNRNRVPLDMFQLDVQRSASKQLM